MRLDLTIKNEEIKQKNILISTQYKYPLIKAKIFKEYLKGFFKKKIIRDKPKYIGNDLNLNLLDYSVNAKLKIYVNLLFQNNCIPLISKLYKISGMNATITDHINSNNYLETDIKTGILESDISDHFPVFLISKTTKANKHSTETFIKW